MLWILIIIVLFLIFGSSSSSSSTSQNRSSNDSMNDKININIKNQNDNHENVETSSKHVDRNSHGPYKTAPKSSIHIQSIDDIRVVILAVLHGKNSAYINNYEASMFEEERQGSASFRGPVYRITLSLSNGDEFDIFYGIITNDRQGMVMSMNSSVLTMMSVPILKELVQKINGLYDLSLYRDAPTRYTYYLEKGNRWYYITNNSGNDSFYIPLDYSDAVHGNRGTILPLLKNNTNSLANRIHCQRYLYHFTDKRNIESIKYLGGLYSWRYLEDNDIDIPMPGGNDLSRELDTRFSDWSDYVRLSFCEYHPMINRLKRAGYDLVILKIDSSIISETSYISDRNATSNDANIQKASDIDDLNDFLDFDAINDNGYIEYGTPEYALHQAEVLIKTKIPLSYIQNI